MDAQQVIDGLADFGFSQYEARAYIGLVGQPSMTGYALSNLTGIPQPKVYETLRRLEEKRAVVLTGSNPARFVAVPPDQLMSAIGDHYRKRLDDVHGGLNALTPGDQMGLRVLDAPSSWDAIRDRAVALLAAGERHIYLSVHVDQLPDIADALIAADLRGTRCDVLCFGQTRLKLTNGRIVEHASTDGVIYRHHQARHLAVVADSIHALWALAADGSQWESMAGDDALLAAAVKGYVRHDLYVQQIFADFGAELIDRYGPALESLVVPPITDDPGAAASTSAQKPAARRPRKQRSA